MMDLKEGIIGGAMAMAMLLCWWCCCCCSELGSVNGSMMMMSESEVRRLCYMFTCCGKKMNGEGEGVVYPCVYVCVSEALLLPDTHNRTNRAWFPQHR